MYPIKEILERQPIMPDPPVLVIDETVIKRTVDAGPFCCCQEKYDAIKKYKPFLPGGINPYKRRGIPDKDCFAVQWKILRVEPVDLAFDKPFAKHILNLPEDFKPEKKRDENIYMMIVPPRYTEAYYQEKLRNCTREHSDYCTCPGHK